MWGWVLYLAGEYFSLSISHQHPNHLPICLVRTLGELPKWSRATCSSTTSPRGRWWMSQAWTNPTSPSTSTRAPPWRPRSELPCTPGTSESNGRSFDVSDLNLPLLQPAVIVVLTLTLWAASVSPPSRRPLKSSWQIEEAGRWLWPYSCCTVGYLVSFLSHTAPCYTASYTEKPVSVGSGSWMFLVLLSNIHFFVLGGHMTTGPSYQRRHYIVVNNIDHHYYYFPPFWKKDKQLKICVDDQNLTPILGRGGGVAEGSTKSRDNLKYVPTFTKIRIWAKLWGTPSGEDILPVWSRTQFKCLHLKFWPTEFFFFYILNFN